MRGDADYRRHLVGVLTKRSIPARLQQRGAKTRREGEGETRRRGRARLTPSPLRERVGVRGKAAETPPLTPDPSPRRGEGRTNGAVLVTKKIQVQASINGKEADFLCEPRQSLLEVLRDELRLTGTKEGCNNGNCGACNVILDGRLVNSCCVLALEVRGRTVTTIEGIAGRRACTRCSRSSWSMPRCSAASARPASSSPPRRCLEKNRSRPSRDPPLAGRQPVPLHRLRQNRARGARDGGCPHRQRTK